ncbi:MAG: reductive dehalogenase domain-containing protein [Spirochaetia bacterium]
MNNDTHRNTIDRFDERDTLFSRVRLTPDTALYNDYYKRRPENTHIDDEFRSKEPGQFSNKLPEAPMVEATFGLIARLRSLVRGYPGEYRYPGTDRPEPRELTEYVKKQAGRYSAVFADSVEMEERFYYSVRGRGDRYGETVKNLLPRGFVCAVQMDKEEISTAPAIREAAEVAGSYLRAAVPALVIAAYLRSLGYEATAHIDGETEVVMPPVAEKAGFGKIGRHGLLVSKKYGSLLRLSVVTTDAPIVISKSSSEVFPLEKACESCRRCAEFCPSDAIPGGSILDNWNNAVRSVDHEACYSMWKKFGTDCGVCLAVCPYNAGASAAASAGKNQKNTSKAEPESPDFLKKYMFG